MALQYYDSLITYLCFFFFLSNILVFKLGGTSLSISVMEVNSGIYRVLSTNTDNNIGGTHFTETLAQYLASEFQRWVLMDLICLMINLKFSFRFNFFPPIYLKLSFQRKAWFFQSIGYFHVWNYKICPGKQGKAEAQLPSVVYLEFSLSVRGHQTLNCVNLDLKFNFLTRQWLLLCLSEGG